MATLEITNKTLKVIGAPEASADEWMLRFVKSLFKGRNDPRKLSERIYSLVGMPEVRLEHDETKRDLNWFIEGMRPRDFWTLLLRFQSGSAQVIASRDYAAIRQAFDKLHAAMNASGKYKESIHIENSTVVVGNAGGNVSNNVSG